MFVKKYLKWISTFLVLVGILLTYIFAELLGTIVAVYIIKRLIK